MVDVVCYGRRMNHGNMDILNSRNAIDSQLTPLYDFACGVSEVLFDGRDALSGLLELADVF